MKTTLKNVLFIAVVVLFAAYPAFGDEGMGMVIGVEGHPVLQRAGADIPVAMKDRVYKNDLLITDALSKVQILLDDDSSISVSNNSRVELKEFSNDAEKPEFLANIEEGDIRIITGGITERNPDGFKLTTKQTTIGIRGTIASVSFDRKKGRTSLNLANTHKGATMGGKLIKESQKASAGEDGISTGNFTPGEKMNDFRRFRIGSDRDSLNNASRRFGGFNGEGDPDMLNESDRDSIIEYLDVCPGGEDGNGCPRKLSE